MRDNDTIGEAAVAVDRRLGYPSRHDWNYLPLPDSHDDWLDAAYEVINQLAAQVEANRVRYTDARRERDEARELAQTRAEAGRRALAERDEARHALVALLEATAPILGEEDDWEDADGNPSPIQAALKAARRAAGLDT